MNSTKTSATINRVWTLHNGNVNHNKLRNLQELGWMCDMISLIWERKWSEKGKHFTGNGISGRLEIEMQSDGIIITVKSAFDLRDVDARHLWAIESVTARLKNIFFFHLKISLRRRSQYMIYYRHILRIFYHKTKYFGHMVSCFILHYNQKLFNIKKINFIAVEPCI